MINNNIQAVILAAGRSTRLNTGNSKLVAPICGKPMLIHTTNVLEHMNIKTTLVVGYQKEIIQETVALYHKNNLFDFVVQDKQLGTGHALNCSQSQWNKDHILVMNGDAPLLTQTLLQELIDAHINKNAVVSLLVAHNVDPSVRGYGHVIYHNNHVKIVEDRHMNHDDLDTININAGIYLFKKSFLLDHIDNLPKHEISGEYYLTTLIEIASNNNFGVCTVDASFDAVRGVNTLKELWVAEHIKRSKLIEHWMEQGVRFSTAHNVTIDESVKIGRGTFIGSNTQLLGDTTVGENTIIGAFSVIENAAIGNNTSIAPHAIIKNSTVGNNCTIEPFTLIQQKSSVCDTCTIESFSHISQRTIKPTTPSVSKKKEKTFVAAFKTVADKNLSHEL